MAGEFTTAVTVKTYQLSAAVPVCYTSWSVGLLCGLMNMKLDVINDNAQVINVGYMSFGTSIN